MGSTLFLLDQNHEIQKTYRYDAFGNILKETGDISNRLAYTGQVYDGETGQYYLRARFYNPKIGRFTQEDIYRGDGLNLYAYCANNPVMYYDPSGYIQLPCVHKYTPATDPYASTNAVSAPGKNATHSGHTYEEAIRSNIYGNMPHIKGHKFTATLDGKIETGFADYIIIFNNKLMPIEAKYVKIWEKSVYNPDYLLKLNNPKWAPDEVGRLLHQAKRYNAAFSEVVYHTNSMDLANYYTKLFNDNGVKNFEFVITPIF